jgi:hypothetical protein
VRNAARVRHRRHDIEDFHLGGDMRRPTPDVAISRFTVRAFMQPSLALLTALLAVSIAVESAEPRSCEQRGFDARR